jgi:hypothetical protein
VLLAKGGRGAHELGWEVEPCFAKVEALTEGGHVVLVGGDVFEERAEKLAIRVCQKWCAGRRLRGICQVFLGRIYIIAEGEERILRWPF